MAVKIVLDICSSVLAGTESFEIYQVSYYLNKPIFYIGISINFVSNSV